MTQNSDSNDTHSNQYPADRKAMHRLHEARGQRTPFTPLQVAEDSSALGETRYSTRPGAARGRSRHHASCQRPTVPNRRRRPGCLWRDPYHDLPGATEGLRQALSSRGHPRAQAAIAELIEVERKVRDDALFTRPGRPHGQALTREQFARIVKGWAALLGCDPSTYLLTAPDVHEPPTSIERLKTLRPSSTCSDMPALARRRAISVLMCTRR